MAFMDVVKWDATGNDVFAYKYPHTNLSTGAQLIVRESQEAVFFSKGQLMGKFGPGKHTLSTENLPLLRNLYGIPFGGKNPFTAEVWFVNKTAPLNIDWKTTTMRFVDPDYGQMVPLIAKGRYGLKVKDAEKFLVQLVGSLEKFTAAELTDHFQGMLISKTNSCIMSYMNANQVGINQISSHLDELSDFIRQPMTQWWSDYGFNLAGFFITEVNLDTSTEEGRAISKALSQRSAQNIAGYTWQQQQMFNAADKAAGQGAGMGILAAGLMSGGFANMNGGMGNAMMQQPYQNQYPNGGMQRQTGYVRKDWFCSVCGSKHPVTSQFCDSCGHRYNPCPVCAGDNPDKATRCIKCGTPLTANAQMEESYCWKCHSPIEPGKKFCPNCGAKQEG